MDWTIQSLTRQTADGHKGLYFIERQGGVWRAFAPDRDTSLFASHDPDLCRAACARYNEWSADPVFPHNPEEPTMPTMPDPSHPDLPPIPSHFDDRTVNNAVRHTYRVLSDIEKKQMQAIKDAGAEFIALLHIVGDTIPGADKFGSRDLSLANTHVEDAVMRAVRHVTA